MPKNQHAAHLMPFGPHYCAFVACRFTYFLVCCVCFTTLTGCDGNNASPVPAPVKEIPIADSPNKTDFPTAARSGGGISMLFYLPDAERGYYRGTRFDHSGIIDQMTVDNHRFFTDFRQPHDPLGHDHIPGTAEEFGMDDPLGYEEAQAGDGFVKIGVGILQRANREPYQFHGKYATIELGKWVITNGDRGLSFLGFEQELHGPRGWAYRYVKKFELLKDSHVNGSDGIAPDWIGFKIVRSLTNLGTKPIHTTHYGHNFLRMDDFPPGVGYTLSFPFEPQLDEKFQTQQVVDVVGHDLIFFSDVLKDKAVFGQIIAPADAESRITLQHDKVPYALQITTSRPILKWMLYCHPPAICPEPFIEINVAPHDTFDWETEYRVLRVAKRDRK